MPSLSSLLTAISVLILAISAQQLNPYDPSAKAGYFVTTTSQDADYVVAINAVQNGDIYFHMSAPTVNSWVGVGIGENMADSLMLVSYKSANGTGVTTSARMGTGHSEPEVLRNTEAHVELIWNDAYAPFCNTASHKSGGIMISHGVCRGCGNVSSLDYTNKAQPFIFAVGPKEDLQDDSVEAPVRRHVYYGRFTMDMTLATTPLDFLEGADYGRVPAPNVQGPAGLQSDTNFQSNHTSPVVDGHVDSDPTPIVHGVMMGVAFIVIFPLGSILLRLTNSVRWHWVVQSVGVLCVIIGFGTGVSVSYEYNRTKSFASAHQSLGLLLLAFTLIQFGLGAAHHLLFKAHAISQTSRRKESRTVWKPIPWLRRPHLVLGPMTLLLALVNGGLGINLARDDFARIPYAAVVAIIGIAFLLVRLWIHFSHRAAAPYKPDEETLQEYYLREDSFGAKAVSPVSVESARSGKSKKKGGVVEEYGIVPVPEAYHEGQTPASAISGWSGRPWGDGGMATPVTVAPPTPRWPAPGGIGMLGRSTSGASGVSVSTTRTEREGLVGKGKGWR
ncbi:hypothetical protein LTR97_012187 [Elasticomyces elasticus]|uniref:Cytochrome b561 domain-containing protein n=1 Tax=Elasticomyces elasticus TaxID=574655 RepID=A0AAN7VRD8_9PEZI|nr:hypothetical protein LTR97_012187 [Elasticomyces elasticus]